MKMKVFLPTFFFLFLMEEVYAHCPLCTIGAAAAAGGALYFGVSQIVIGLFIGGFAVSMGWWISRLIKKKYVPFQRELLILISFVTTILPLLSILNEFYPFFLSLGGDYGSLFNRTYLVNMFLVGSIIGGIIVLVSPWLSKRLSGLREGNVIPFQGIIITLLLLVITGGIIQLLI